MLFILSESPVVVDRLPRVDVTTVGTASLNWKYTLSPPSASTLVIPPGFTFEVYHVLPADPADNCAGSTKLSIIVLNGLI